MAAIRLKWLGSNYPGQGKGRRIRRRDTGRNTEL